MNTKTARTRIIGALVAGIGTGILAAFITGFGVYELLGLANGHDGWQDLGNFALAGVLGILVGYAAYLVMALRLIVEVQADGGYKLGRLRIAIAPFVFVVVMYGLLNQTARTSVDFNTPLIIALLAMALVAVPLPAKQAIVAAGVVGVTATLLMTVTLNKQHQQERADQVQDRIDLTNSYKNWNGPLMLINGNSPELNDLPWRASVGEAPSNNDYYESAQLFWRQGDVDSPDGLLMTASFYNEPAATHFCAYESCGVVGQSIYGPVYKSETLGNTYAVDVPKGHMEVDGPLTELSTDQALAIFNSLQPVDSTTYANVQNGLSGS